jgi:hypothetical protein
MSARLGLPPRCPGPFAVQHQWSSSFLGVSSRVRLQGDDAGRVAAGRNPNDQVQRVQLGNGELLTVYRLVTTNDRDDSAFVDCFRSNAEKGKAPRGREARQPLIHAGLSAFKTKEQAIDRQRRIVATLKPGEAPRIGRYVATVDLHGPTASYEDRNEPDGHMTVWAEASTAARSVIDIERIEG